MVLAKRFLLIHKLSPSQYSISPLLMHTQTDDWGSSFFNPAKSYACPANGRTILFYRDDKLIPLLVIRPQRSRKRASKAIETIRGHVIP